MSRAHAGRAANNRIARLLALAALVSALAPACAGADDAAAVPRVVALRIGFNGRYQAGRWTPIVATLEAGAADFEGQVWLTAADGDGTPYRVPVDGDVVTIAAGQRRDVTFCFKPAALDNDFGIEIVHNDGKSRLETFSGDNERVALRVPRAMPTNEHLIVSVGPALGLNAAFGLAQESTGGATRSVELDDLSSLPTNWFGFDAIDTLFVSTGSPELNAAWAKDPERLAALTAWVRQGGRLVLTVGREAEAVLSPGHPLASLVPGKFEGQIALLDSQASAWEEYAASLQPLSALQSTTGEERLRVPLVTGLPGKVESPANLAQGQPPLVTRIPLGLGEIVLVAADLDQPPFARWSGRTNLLRRLTRTRLPGEINETGSAASRAPIQQDLVEQLRRALDVFPGVSLAPFFWVAMLVAGYVALIGPGDFKLQRYLGRMELTWLTFPLLVVATSVGGYWFAGWLKGDQLRINQVDVIDVDAEGQVRGITIANLFSPEMKGYDVTVRPSISAQTRVGDPTLLLSSFALAPAALSGESGGATAEALTSEAYEYAPGLTEIHQLPMLVWSSKSISAEWHGQVLQLVESKLQLANDELPEGELQLAANLALDDAWLVYDNTVTRLGRLASGRRVDIGSQSGSVWSTLSTLLRYQRRVQKTPGKDEYTMMGTQWDAESTDVREIIRQIMFYDAAGGSDYSRAWNGALRKLDLSTRRDLGQAMLIGFVSDEGGGTPGAQLLHDGQPLRGTGDQHWTVLRILLPVHAASKPSSSAVVSP